MYPYDFSVMMITYNHEKFLAQAIESVLTQQFDFTKLEIVIGVDKSSDATLKVAEDYREKYPSLIKLIAHEDNVGMYQNFMGTLKACRGKYIALLEGDDYWSDTKKLQTQYSFFEKNPNCVLSGGLSSQLNGNEEEFRRPLFSGFFKGKPFTKNDLVYSNRLTTLTTAFRADALNWDELNKLQNSPHLDWGVYLSLQYGEKGFAYRFNRKFGVYRMHAGGVYSLVDTEKRNINFLKTIRALSSLQLKPSQQLYLKSLFANFALQVTSKEFFSSKAFVDYYDSSLVIYTQKNQFTPPYRKDLYKKIFTMKKKQRAEFIRSNFELIRQTKTSNLVYANMFLFPFLMMVFFLKVQLSLIKYGGVKN